MQDQPPSTAQAPSRTSCDVVVVGAGIVGAALAAAMRPSGLDTVLLDAETPPPAANEPWDSRIYAISPGSCAFLQACGAWQRLPQQRIARVEAMQVRGDAYRAGITFSAYDCGIAELCFIVESREIQRALAAVLAEPGGPRTLFGRSPVALALDEGCAVLELDDGNALEARLVVGADGPKSWIRDAAGIDYEARSYGQQGVVANFETERPHRSVARQWFLRDSVLALLPLPGNRVSLVWSTSDAHAERLVACAPDELAHAVASACNFELGELAALTSPRAFPLQLLEVAETVRPRIALVGDAAHVVHPLAGQGLNLGLQDAAELARVLRGRGQQDDCGDYRLLRRYARSRAEAVRVMQWTTDGLQRLFGASGHAAQWLRNRGLGLVDGIVPLKSVLVGHALA